jgi:serine/threonine protein kinase
MPPFTINIKRYKRPFFLNRIIYTFFRKPKAERAYIHSERLIGLGINSPQPVAFFVMKHNMLIRDSFYLSLQVSLPRNMYEFGKGGIEGREHILRAFAAFTARLHELGALHRDYSPGNILFDDCNGLVTFCLVDVNRMSFGPVSLRKGCAAFASLWGPGPMFALIADEYARIRRADPARCLRMISSFRQAFWKRYSAKHGMPY